VERYNRPHLQSVISALSSSMCRIQVWRLQECAKGDKNSELLRTDNLYAFCYFCDCFITMTSMLFYIFLFLFLLVRYNEDGVR
jgi:hypothetical protein